MDHSEIIDSFGGTECTARFFNIRPSSVSDWRKKRIPRGRLIEMAPVLEMLGFKSRMDMFPDRFHLIWPELKHLRSPTPFQPVVSSAQSSDADFSPSPDGLGAFFIPALCELCRKGPSMSASTGERN